MKIFTLPGSIFCTLSLGFLLFSLGCADYPIQNSPTVSRLDSYGIRSETYERITMGEPLSYEDIMNLEACHVPQETINYLYAKQNNDYFKKKYHSCTHHSSQVALEESRECLEAETEKATHKAEDQLQRLADEENRKHLAVEAEARVKEETEKAAHEAEDQLRRLKDEENRKYLAAEAEARVKEEAEKAPREAEHQLRRLKKVF